MSDSHFLRRVSFSSALSAAALSAQSVAVFDWQVETSPPGRTNATFAYHAALGATVLFGGSQGELYNDTWLWNGRWRRLDANVHPTPRHQHAVAYDSLRQRLVLFGGIDASGLRNDTWAFGSDGWSQLAPTTSPPPTARHTMAYDAGRDRIVLIGGIVSSFGGSSVAMWEFDGSTWTLSVPGSEPSSFGSLVYDSARAQLLSLNATGLRAWDGTSWQPKDNSGLPAGAIGDMLYDAHSARVLLPHPRIGNNQQSAIYARQGSGWSLVGTPPIPPNFQRRVYDDARQRLVAYDDQSFSGIPRQAATWELEAMAWQVVAQGPPLGRSDAAMAYDVARHRTVLHGGTSNSALFDTWELADRQWFLGSGGVGGFLDRTGHTMVYDEGRSLTVLLGGDSLGANEVLEWNGNGTWNYRNPSFAPAGRHHHAAAYDSLRGRMLVFGGQVGSAVVGDTWAWDGSAWTALIQATGPTPRRETTMSYDRTRDRAVLFGGVDASGALLADTWEFDGAHWSPAAPGPSPSPRSGHVQVYDSHLQRTIVYGGTDGISALNDTWLWDGVTWAPLVTAHHPDAGAGACAAYDPVRREVILFGGTVARAELWRLRDTTLGSWSTTGQGCDSGDGPLTLTALDPLVIGASARLDLAHVPQTFFVLPIVWVGFDDQQWEGAQLPVSLDVLGSPDCALRTQPIVPLFLLAAAGGNATGSLTLPADPDFVGDRLFLQGFTWDFTQPRIATANLLTGTIGVR